jgi:hypothetical protein
MGRIGIVEPAASNSYRSLANDNSNFNRQP